MDKNLKQTQLSDVVDMKVYPIQTDDSDSMTQAVTHFAEAMNETGCVVIPRFIKPECIDLLQRESCFLAPEAYFCKQKVNAYATADDPALSPDDPRRMFQNFSNGFVAQDKIPVDSIVKTIYHSPAFKQFIARILGLETIFEYADPIAGVVINVMPSGSELPWHFDTNDFVVSLMTLPAQSGGSFEYCPNLRKPNNENFPQVRSVIHGDRTGVISLDLQPGDVQLFRGRNSLHRVSPTLGERHTVLFGYSTQPGVIGRVERTRKVYGRVLQAHIDAERHARADGLID